MSLEVVAEKALDDSMTIEASVVSESSQKLFVVVSDTDYQIDQNNTARTLLVFSFNDTGFDLSAKGVPLDSLGLSNNNDVDIQL